MKYYFHAFKNYAKSDGRASRKEYWWFILFHYLAVFIFSFLDAFFDLLPKNIPLDYGYLTLIYLFASACPAICLQVRRLHDIGKSGGLWWLKNVPIISFYVLYLNCKASDPGINAYGAPSNLEITPIGNKEKKAVLEIDNTKTNTQLGTKWFTFYTKVRPWFACVMFLPTLVDFIEYIDTYLSVWWMLLAFAASVAQCVLSIMVFIKSQGDYVEFVRFVKGVLLFETINIAYQQGAQQYINNGFNIGYALLMLIIMLALAYFLWYRLNVKYFNKRINVIKNDYLEDDLNRITQCKSCGYQNKDYFDACPKCGKYSKQYINLNENSPVDKYNAENISSFPDLDIDKMTPQEAAEYLVAEQIHRTRTQESQEVREQGVALYCTHCGKSLVTNSNFCAYCGTQIYHKK